MAVYIFSHRRCIETAKNIRASLAFFEKLLNEPILVTSNIEAARGKVLLNWGRSDINEQDFLFQDLIINSPEIVRISSRRLYNGIGVDFIQWYDDSNPDPDRFPVLTRPRLSGTMGGEGLRKIESIEDYNGELYSYFEKFNIEYRILLFGHGEDFTYRVFKKEKLNEEDFILNNETSKFKFIRRPKIRGLRDFLNNIHDFLSAISVFYFVGLDVGRKGRGLKLIEINSAPGLNSTSVGFFTTIYTFLFFDVVYRFNIRR